MFKSGMVCGVAVVLLLLTGGGAVAEDKEWVDPEALAPEASSHELTREQTLSIAQIQRTLLEVDTLPLEEWLNGFRHDDNPDQEIEIWKRIADAYTEFLRGRQATLEYKKEVFKVLVACSMMPREFVAESTGVKLLTAKEVIAIMDLFYGVR